MNDRELALAMAASVQDGDYDAAYALADLLQDMRAQRATAPPPPVTLAVTQLATHFLSIAFVRERHPSDVWWNTFNSMRVGLTTAEHLALRAEIARYAQGKEMALPMGEPLFRLWNLHWEKDQPYSVNRVLAFARAVTFPDAFRMGPKRILAVRGCGPAILARIRQILASRGLNWTDQQMEEALAPG